MRTAILIGIGFVLLGASVLVGRALSAGGAAQATKWFVPLWFAVAAVNMALGVFGAGYGIWEEAPIFAVIFVPPAVCAYALWRNRRAT